jgi:large subunit ribosomal protein L17
VALFRHGRIKTTEAKAKELRRVAEKLITISKRGVTRAEDQGGAALLAARRRARRWIDDPEVLRKLFDDFAGRYAERPGGYTRVLKLNPRAGDNAPMALIELMPDEPKVAAPAIEETPAKSRKKAKAAPAEEPATEAAEAAAEAKPKRRSRKKKVDEE